MKKTTAKKKKRWTRYTFEYVLSPNNLHAKITTKSMKDGQIILDNVEEKDFTLKEISLDQLMKYRANFRSAGFVLKIKDSYFYARIPKNLRIHSPFFTLKGFKASSPVHLCGQSCKRLSAAQDCDGGCQKVRDLSISVLIGEEGFSKEDALVLSERIEKYPFIRFGFESFNTVADAVYVLNCKHFSK